MGRTLMIILSQLCLASQAFSWDGKRVPDSPTHASDATPPSQSSISLSEELDPSHWLAQIQSPGSTRNAQAQSAELKRALDCGPIVVYRAPPASYYAFRLAECNSENMPKAEIDRLLAVLRETYGDPNSQKAQDALVDAVSMRPSERQNERSEARAAAAAIRQKQLRAGTAKISSFEDAGLYHEHTDLLDLMQRPPIHPDSKIYAGLVFLEGVEDRGLLRVRTERWGQVAYAWLRLDTATQRFSAQHIRVNNGLRVIGRYKSNVNYRTVTGSQRTAPLLDAMYLYGCSDTC